MTGITDEQKRQQDAAAYGLPHQAIDPSKFTHEQIEAFREVVFQRDAANAAMTREFDLNRPPTPPYRYQEFPRMLYLGSATKIVKNASERDKSLAAGWTLDPQQAVEVAPAPALEPAVAAEAAAMDAKLKPERHDFTPAQIEMLRKMIAEHDDRAKPTKKRTAAQIAATERWNAAKK